MKNRDKQILALRTAYIAGIFSLIICSVMLLNYWQLVTTDPLESEAIKTLFEQYMDDTSNEEIKLQLRSLDLMARNAYFNNQWQIRSGAYLLIGGIIVMVIALRVYFSTKSQIVEPEAKDGSLDIELYISRKWILYTLSFVFGLALIASFLSADHLSESYAFAEITSSDEVPVQQITPREEGEVPTRPTQEGVITESDVAQTEQEVTSENEAITEQSGMPAEKQTEVPSESAPALASVPDINEITRNHPSFRGPLGQGISHHSNIPTSWDGASGANILWKIPVPLHGYSSPVIWGNSLFLTGADEQNQSIYCYDTESGNLIWEHKVTGISRPRGTIDPTEDTGFAAPTATTDGRYVLAIFATGDLVCTDLDGNRLWSKNIGIPDNHYGHSSSLLVWQNLVLVQFDTNEVGQVFGYDVSSGDLVWETTRTSKISWASPIIAEVGDHYELILASSPYVSAYDPGSGNELWSFDCLSGEVGPSLAFDKGTLFAANEYAQLIAFKPGSPPTELWKNNEYLPEVSSPVAAKDLLFIGTSYGVIVCYSATSGDIMWEYDANSGFYASPIIVEDKVYFLDRGGKMYIFSIEGTPNLINDPELGERTVSTPAFSEGRIYIRSLEHLYCIGS